MSNSGNFYNSNGLESDCGPLHSLQQDVTPQFNPPQRSIFDPVVAQDIPPPQNDPYAEYRVEARRLETYANWPPGVPVTPQELARNGFVYCGSGDRVQCVFCRSVLRNWALGDVVEVEHKKNCPDCAFAHGYNVGNVPLLPLSQTDVHGLYAPGGQPQTQYAIGPFQQPSAAGNFGYNPGPASVPYFNQNTVNSPQQYPSSTITSPAQHNPIPSNCFVKQNVNVSDAHASANSLGIYTDKAKYPDWQIESVRVGTFVGWPPHMPQRPEAIAKAGLFYLGTADRCKCFWCGGELFDWEPQDDPWEEHAKWFPTCGYLKFIKGDDYIKKVQDILHGRQPAPVPSTPSGFSSIVPNINADPFVAPHVQAVLQNGYTRSQVQAAFDRYGQHYLGDARSLVQAIEEVHKQQAAGQKLTNNYDEMEVEDETHIKVVNGTSPWQPSTQPTVTNSNQSQGATGGATQPVFTFGDIKTTVGKQGPAKKDDKLRTDTKEKKKEERKEDEKKKEKNAEPTETSGATAGGSKPELKVEKILKENEELKDQRLCKICMDEEVCVTFLPCGHLACCASCSVAVKDCPICRKKIEGSVKTYWA